MLRHETGAPGRAFVEQYHLRLIGALTILVVERRADTVADQAADRSADSSRRDTLTTTAADLRADQRTAHRTDHGARPLTFGPLEHAVASTAGESKGSRRSQRA